MATAVTRTSEPVIAELLSLRSLIDTTIESCAEPIADFCELVASTLRDGRTLFFAGNGGSAADAQHMATEYVVRYTKNRIPLAAVALTTDTSLLTAAGNDLGFDTIFARQIEALGKSGDLLVLHSTSGRSPNLSAAAAAARRRGVKVAALLAKGGGTLKDEVDFALVLPTDSTSHAQELQLAIEHIVCGQVERILGVA